MLFLALGCGMLTATNGVYFKLAGELIKSGNAFGGWLFYSFVVLGFVGGTLQLTFLQLLMKKYN